MRPQADAGLPPFDPFEPLPLRPAAVAPAAAGSDHGAAQLVGVIPGEACGGEWGAGRGSGDAGWAGGIGGAGLGAGGGAGDDPFHEDWRDWAGR